MAQQKLHLRQFLPPVTAPAATYGGASAAVRRSPGRALPPALVGAIWAAALTLCQAAHGVVVQGMRLYEAPEHTRVVFDTSGPVHYELLRLSNPHRVAVDFQNATLADGFDPGGAAAGNRRIERIRVAPRGQGWRVVLDLAAAFEPKHFTLDPQPPYDVHRLVIDLLDRGRRQPPPAPPQAEGRDVVIAVDAGHGGEDPGAIGARGLYEKTVVLQMARKLAARFNQTPGYRAVLVRKGDYYIPLRKRLAIARRERADMFLSIHADAARSSAPSGASVYALSQRGASSEEARWLAEKENRSDLIGGDHGNVSLDGREDVLAKVLVDMAMDQNLAASVAAGEAVLKQLGSVTKLHSNKVGQAGFVVLKSPDIQSLLIETGFISHPREARRLSQADHQNRIVRAIHAGVTLHMESSPPAGTLLANRLDSGNQRYTVMPGDTLSEIAARYGTSTARIRRANDLRGDHIQAGKTILIPAGS